MAECCYCYDSGGCHPTSVWVTTSYNHLLSSYYTLITGFDKSRVGEYICCGMQEFTAGHKYDVVWCQWVRRLPSNELALPLDISLIYSRYGFGGEPLLDVIYIVGEGRGLLGPIWCSRYSLEVRLLLPASHSFINIEKIILVSILMKFFFIDIACSPYNKPRSAIYTYFMEANDPPFVNKWKIESMIVIRA